MANRLFSPNQQYSDTTGLPYAGGSLTFEVSGAPGTPLATYSNRALTIANTNPVVLDSAGRAGNIFLQNLAYNVILKDSNNNVIWTADPVYSSDFSTTASFMSGAGSPNGNTAGSQGSPTVPASVYWDTTNNILYVCTTTGNAVSAVWTAVNASTAAAVIFPPQGYLTLTSGTPIISADAIAASSAFYTPYVGNLVPVYNGTSFAPTVFSELTLTLVGSHAGAAIYDVFVFNNSGVLTLVTGPAWASSGVGTSARGSGAGTTQLSRLSGLWVNTVQITGRNGANTYTIPSSQATFLGSIYTDAAAGQVSCYTSWGSNRKWGVSNAYNRVPVVIKSGAIGSAYSYTTGAWRVVAANVGSILTTFSCLAEERYDATFVQQTLAVTLATGQSSALSSGIGLNTTASPTGPYITNNFTNSNVSGITLTLPGHISKYQSVPLLGVQQFNPLENGAGCTNNSISAGSEVVSTISVQWRA